MRSSPLVRGVSVLWLACACAAASPDAGSDAPGPGEEARAGTGFENPGGMWMPGQMAAHEKTLRELGVAYDPAALADPTAFPLGAIVSLGGCSASFVSPEGLIATNHHCVTGALQYNSKPENNLLVEGFLAEDRAAERSAGPTARVYVTTGFQDVTARVLEGTDAIAEDKERADAIDRRRKEIVGECENGRPEVSCRVASYFEGAQFFRIEQLELRDIRLVYAPHSGIGVFGGEVDNWRWPRHTGDFSFYRAYVGKDGKPADFAADNVPYRPPHHLEVADQPLREGDFVMVAGYPGRTTRLKTSDEVRNAVAWYYPYAIARNEQTIAALEALTKQDPELAIKAASSLRGLANVLTNNRGMLDGLAKGGVADLKAAEEAKLRQWIAADAARTQRYGTVLDDIARLDAERRKTQVRDAAFSEIVGASALLGRAQLLLEIADQRPKPDAERSAGMQERDWPRVRQGIEVGATRYDRRLDRARLRLALVRVAALPAADRPAAFELVVGQGKGSEADIDAALEGLYARTKLEDTAWVMDQFDRAKPAKLRKSKDPFIALAVALEPEVKASRDAGATFDGAMAKLRPIYVAALRELRGGTLAPDANGTLRITYGTVRGYRPTPDAPVYRPFTTVSEMVRKHTGEEPFAAPARILEAARAKRFGPYVAEELGEPPLDFLADCDITGGNSGSATLDARGRLVGLAFDGNYEAMASDWIFLPEITRSIHVDIRYVLWVMDAVDGADHLVEEMGVTPSI
jgi:V8-like Glu-specific endopeptidase